MLLQDEHLLYLKSEIMKGNVDVFYHDDVWNKKRLDILKRDHYECQRCKRINHRITRANIVHHKVHLRDNPDLMLDDENLEAICFTCHNIEHPEKLFKNKRKRFINEEKW